MWFLAAFGNPFMTALRLLVKSAEMIKYFFGAVKQILNYPKSNREKKLKP
jgi:hypothetical protein